MCIRDRLFAVGGDGEAVFTLLLQPDLHIIPGDVPAILSTQTDVLEGLTAYKDVPVLQYLFGGVLLEVDQFKQFDLVALWGEDQFMLFAAHAQLKGDFIKGDVYKRQLLLSVDLGNISFFAFGRFTVRVIVIIVRVTVR